jgi:superfamily I DNA and/or RNA helicase
MLLIFSTIMSRIFFQVSTIDGFQGDQNDVIILSLVRCNPDGAIGFLTEQSRRCVAQSRARCAMVIIGSAATLTHSPASPWGPLIRQALLTGGKFRPQNS